MPTYLVTVPIVGKASVEVEADNENAAIEAAVEQVTINEVEEWEPLRRIVKGNICYASFVEATAKEV